MCVRVVMCVLVRVGVRMCMYVYEVKCVGVRMCVCVYEVKCVGVRMCVYVYEVKCVGIFIDLRSSVSLTDV